MSLVSRISAAGEDPEDLLSSALNTLYPDDVANVHGESGSTLVYTSPHLRSPVPLRLSEPAPTDVKLYSHHLWNSSLLLAELIEADTLGLRGDGEALWANVRFDVAGRDVLELGAGTGLASIMTGLVGARRITATDYPSPAVVETLKHNVERNVKPGLAPEGTTPTSQVLVCGHSWGELDDEFSIANRHAFDLVVAADVLWMPWQHDNLRSSLGHFLSTDEGARCWIVGGLHTGRDKIGQFLDAEALGEFGLQLEHVWERDCERVEREWQAVREDEFSLRKRWLIVIILKRL